MNILFVCTGNLNRSPMAETLLRKFASRDGRKDIVARSAGTHAFAGNPLPPEAIAVAEQAGIDLSNHRTSPVTRELIDWAERIMVMGPEHRDFIEANFPDALDKVDEVARYRPGGRPGDSIPDPIGQTMFFYRQCYGELMQAVQGFYAKLKNGSL